MEIIIDFEDYLQDQHLREEPMILDDDIPDAFNDWLCSQDSHDLIAHANKYTKQLIEKRLQNKTTPFTIKINP